MLSVIALKANGFQNRALKLFPPISIRNKVRNMCCRKFNSRNDSDGKFHKLASGFGYGIGIAILFGISNFHHRKKNTVNFSEMIGCNFSYCESVIPPDLPQSPRNSFNFLADVVEKTQNSVVYIEVNAKHPYTGDHIPISNGSGFIIKEDGLILTNAHVVNHYGHLTVKLHDGTTFRGIVEDIDTESDLATVRIKAKNLPALRLGASSDIRPGEFVIAMGNPLSLSHTITAGVVSSVKREGKELGLHQKSDYIQTDATIHVGNSGGPLVNLDGEAIGINTMKVTEGISFAIPSDAAINFLKNSEQNSRTDHCKIKKSKQRKQRFLGITMLTLSPTLINELRERQLDFAAVDHGVLVWRVMIGSPSYEVGIRPGDVIVEVNEQEVRSAETILSLLETEDTLKLTINRGFITFQVTVSLMEPVMP